MNKHLRNLILGGILFASACAPLTPKNPNKLCPPQDVERSNLIYMPQDNIYLLHLMYELREALNAGVSPTKGPHLVTGASHTIVEHLSINVTDPKVGKTTIVMGEPYSGTITRNETTTAYTQAGDGAQNQTISIPASSSNTSNLVTVTFMNPNITQGTVVDATTINDASTTTCLHYTDTSSDAATTQP